MGQFNFIISIALSLITTVFLLFKSLKSSVKQLKCALREHPDTKSEPSDMEIIAMICAMGAGTLMIPFMNKKTYSGDHAYFLAQDHMLTILIFAAVAFVSYLMIRSFKHKAGPVLMAFVSLGVLTGIVLYTTLLVHFSMVFLISTFMLYFSLIIHMPHFFIAAIIILCLPAAILFMVAAFIEASRYNYHILRPYYRSGFLKSLADLYEHSVKGYFSITLLWFGFVQLIQSFLTLFGQKPDSYIKAFTEACHFYMLGSGECYTTSTTHYLCTIAANGNRHLVKPLRPGKRNGKWILVNRQLMVCNAFEEWLAEKAPPLQRWLRKRYDALEIPVIALSRYKWLANLLYIGSKPMEWLFALVLYLFDPNPEKRIQKQYLPDFDQLAMSSTNVSAQASDSHVNHAPTAANAS